MDEQLNRLYEKRLAEKGVASEDRPVMDLAALPVGAVLSNAQDVEDGWATHPFTFEKLSHGEFRRSDGVHYPLPIMERLPRGLVVLSTP